MHEDGEGGSFSIGLDTRAFKPLTVQGSDPIPQLPRKAGMSGGKLHVSVNSQQLESF